MIENIDNQIMLTNEEKDIVKQLEETDIIEQKMLEKIENENIVIIPDICWQPNIISRAIYMCNPLARKIMAMAIAVLPQSYKTIEDCVIKIPIKDFRKIMNLKDGTKQRECLKNAIDELQTMKITLADTKKIYSTTVMFTNCLINWEKKVMLLAFKPIIAKTICEMKGKTKILLENISKLESKYAIRIYEIAMSYAGFEGIEGNKEKEWRTPIYSIELLKKILMIDETQYVRKINNKNYFDKNNFIKKVIKQPIEEINKKNLNIKIYEENVIKHNSVEGYIFRIKINEYYNKQIIKQEQKEKTIDEKTKEKLLKMYKEEYNIILQEELKKEMPKSYKLLKDKDTIWYKTCEENALEILKNNKGVVLG